MSSKQMRNWAKNDSIHRSERLIDRPLKEDGNYQTMSEYYGENVFHYDNSTMIPDEVKKELNEIAGSNRPLREEIVKVVADAVTRWAISKGATHFSHWFQPLTGSTAEKHDSFLDIKDGMPIERLSPGQLMQGEPDASSFPNGGSRSTFEARGYTSWDLTSPMFLMEGGNGKTLCIPTAFVSYNGEALDIKTPLLRSNSKINEVATTFLNLAGRKTKSVQVNCGAEQEYFLIDKSFYFSRPDLVMTGRAVIGAMCAKNQQLDDHYFGAISERVLSFMQELDLELHRMGIPAKTRHNEVAPGQFEMAPIFTEANLAADHNQQVMALIKKTAGKHDLIALLHEKPFAGINGSGKHVNWSMSTDSGMNLLSPGDCPQQNTIFLAVTAIVIEAVRRHAKLLRASIASHGNDHRLGANEAPPSIISVFLGDTLDKIFSSIKVGKEFTPATIEELDLGATQLANLSKDNTDRNRTSPFAFTGNKFEFRAVGSSASIGVPLTVLNAAVASVFEESNLFLKSEIKSNNDIDAALMKLTKKWVDQSYQVVFNGDGYSKEWLKEAEERGLPNLPTTADCLKSFIDTKDNSFLIEMGIYNQEELETRYNVLIERYNTLRKIEFKTLNSLLYQNVIPSVVSYKRELGEVIATQQEIGVESTVELAVFKKLTGLLDLAYASAKNIKDELELIKGDEQKVAEAIAHKIYPLSEELADLCNELEDHVPTEKWGLPSYFDMLYLR